MIAFRHSQQFLSYFCFFLLDLSLTFLQPHLIKRSLLLNPFSAKSRFIRTVFPPNIFY